MTRIKFSLRTNYLISISIYMISKLHDCHRQLIAEITASGNHQENPRLISALQRESLENLGIQ